MIHFPIHCSALQCFMHVSIRLLLCSPSVYLGVSCLFISSYQFMFACFPHSLCVCASLSVCLHQLCSRNSFGIFGRAVTLFFGQTLHLTYPLPIFFPNPADDPSAVPFPRVTAPCTYHPAQPQTGLTGSAQGHVSR